MQPTVLSAPPPPFPLPPWARLISRRLMRRACLPTTNFRWPVLPVCELQTTCPAAPQVSLVPFAPMHAASWNGFVDIVRFNLVTADW